MQESMNTEATSVERNKILKLFKNFNLKGAFIGVGIFLLLTYACGAIMPMDETEYLQEASEVMEEVGGIVTTVNDFSLNYANTPDKADILSDVASDLEDVKEELEELNPPKKYKDLHKRAIDNVNSFRFYLQNEIDGIENQDLHLIAIGIKGRTNAMIEYNSLMEEYNVEILGEDCPECMD